MTPPLDRQYRIGQAVYLPAYDRTGIITDFPRIGRNRMIEVELATGRLLIVSGKDIAKDPPPSADT